MHKTRLFEYLLILLISGCAVKVPKQTEPKYEEDLSLFRTTYQYKDQPQDKNTIVENNLDQLQLSDTSSTSLNIKSELDLFLDTVSYNSRRIGYIQGFTIQVYTGNSREAANEAKSMVYKMLPGSFPQLLYQQPNFKVKVGKFYTRFDAQKTFNQLKREFPRAIVIPERIVIN
jgi:hypothetical protein